MTTTHFFQSHSGLHRTVCLASVPWSEVLELCVTHIWELRPQVFESTAGFIHDLQNFCHDTQLYVQRGQKIFLRKNKRRIDDIFLLWRQWCSFRPQFIYIVILLVPAVPLTWKQQYFVYPSYIPSNSTTTLRSPHNFHLNSSYLIFPNSSFMLS